MKDKYIFKVGDTVVNKKPGGEVFDWESALIIQEDEYHYKLKTVGENCKEKTFYVTKSIFDLIDIFKKG